MQTVDELPAHELAVALGGVALARAALGRRRLRRRDDRRGPQRCVGACDFDLQQLGGVASLIAVGRSGASKRESLSSPTRSSTAETVESAIRQAEGDLSTGHPQLAQPHDHLDELVGRACGIDFGSDDQSAMRVTS
jgi:hypothetical protein